MDANNYLDVRDGRHTNNQGTARVDRIFCQGDNLSVRYSISSGTHNTNEWFNPAAFTTPAAFSFGNLGRNTVYGPGMQTLDLALVRTFTITEAVRFE